MGPIALFKADNEEEKDLDLEDFERQPNGDFVWVCKKAGTVYNKTGMWPVDDGCTVTLTKYEYEQLLTKSKI